MSSSPTTGTIGKVKQTIADWYLVYELRTSLYTLEPWEKAMFNSFLVAFMSMGCYTAYVFLPRYTSRVLHYFNLI